MLLKCNEILWTKFKIFLELKINKMKIVIWSTVEIVQSLKRLIWKLG